MAYHSRRYLAEKWAALKYDMEIFLDVDDAASLGDEIDQRTIDRCKDNIVECCRAIVMEVSK